MTEASEGLSSQNQKAAYIMRAYLAAIEPDMRIVALVSMLVWELACIQDDEIRDSIRTEICNDLYRCVEYQAGRFAEYRAAATTLPAKVN